MFNEFLKTTQELYQSKEPFALAFVVNRKLPSSGKPGDKAVILKNGKIIGWIGGGCTQGIVLKEASEAIKDGKPRLVRIKPDGTGEAEIGVVDYQMTCHSGGAVQIYIEPVLPRPQLLIMGKSHVGMALSKIGKAMDYPVVVFARGAELNAFPDADAIIEEKLTAEYVRSNTCIAVCTQGENDEDALEQALKSGASYIAFVASRKKASAVFHQLRQRGITFDQLKQIKTPAGLDIGAKLPEEVAISMIAEMITFMRSEENQSSNAIEEDRASEPSDLFINPVCNVPVSKSSAKHIIDYEGEKYYFCCDGCKVTFEKDPEKYALSSASV